MHSYETQLAERIAAIAPVDEVFETDAWERLDSLTKPAHSLGTLEHIAVRVACIQKTVKPSVGVKCIHVMAGDHGVVAQGVSPFPQDVTWQMAANVVSHGAGINQIADSTGASVEVFDVGIARDVSFLKGVADRKIALGTADMSKGAAMTREQAAQAVLVGMDEAARVAAAGCTLIGTGELGIGNTTAASAVVSAYLGIDPATVVGRGTGLDDAGMAHKAEVIREAIRVNGTDESDALGVLAAVGGFELAAMTGTILGAAEAGITVVCDGFISTSSALAAVRLAPQSRGYLLPSHLSAEPGHRVVMDALGLEPILTFDMRLGEGTGAALAFGVIDAACRVMSGMATFAEAAVSGKSS